MTAPHLILGVDPGMSGAMALFDPVKNELVTLADMPTHKITVNLSPRTVQDPWGIARFIDVHSSVIKMAVIEEPHAMPQQGVTSAFSFGRALGEVVGVVIANFVRVEFVRPAKWKRVLGLSHDKDHSRRAASARWPQHADLFSRSKDDGRAEAALLAYYGTKIPGG